VAVLLSWLVAEPFVGPATASTGTLRLTILDRDSGAPTPARVMLLDDQNHAHLPPDAIEYPAQCSGWISSPPTAPDPSAVVSITAPFGGPDQFYVVAPIDIPLAAGTYRISAQKGPEYLVVERTVSIADGAASSVELVMERWADMAAEGWFSADDHLHIPRPDDAGPTLDTLLTALMKAEDLNVANLLQMGAFDGVAASTQRAFGSASVHQDGDTILASGQENPRTWLLGHGIVLGADAYIDFPDRYLAYGDLWRAAAAHGGLRGYAHLNAGGLVRDATRGMIEFLEVFQVSLAYYGGLYGVLNLGIRLTPTAGTDFPCGFASPPGSERFYTRIDGALDYPKWLDAVRSGRTFVTNGPLLDFTIDGRGPGATIDLDGPSTVTVEATVRFDPTRDDVDRLEIVQNGQVVAMQPASGLQETPGRSSLRLALVIDQPGWIAARASGTKRGLPPLGTQPRTSDAHTAPVYVDIADRVCRDSVRAAATEATYVLRQTVAGIAAISPDTASVFLHGVDGPTLAHGRQTVFDEFDEALSVIEPLRECRSADAAPLTRRQRTCVRAMARGVARITAQVDARVGRCLGAQAADDSFERCIGGDPTGRILYASQRTAEHAAERCAPPFPPFGTSRVDVVTDVAGRSGLDLVRDVFGSTLDGAVTTDRAMRTCRRAVWKAVTRCHHEKLRRYGRCAATALEGAGSSGPVVSNTELRERCVPTTPAGMLASDIADDRCVRTPGRGLLGLLREGCTPEALKALLGPCGVNGVQATAHCLDRRIECRACLAIGAATGPGLYCDRLDDGLVNASCS